MLEAGRGSVERRLRSFLGEVIERIALGGSKREGEEMLD